MPITILDLVLLAVMLISGLLAMVRGFMREILSIAAWGAAALVTLYAFSKLLPTAKTYFNNDTVAAAVVVAGTFIGTLIVVSVITVRISDMILDSRIGALDRTLGFLFGLGRGLLIVVVAFLFFSWLVPDKQRPDWVTNAKSRVVLQGTGDWLMALLPDDPENTILKRLKKNKPDDEQPDTEHAARGSPAVQHGGRGPGAIVSFAGTRFHSERRFAVVGATSPRREVIERLPGNAAIGHVRYSTTGATILRNVQPLFAELNAGGFAVGHNGNLTNGLSLRRQLVGEGAIMQSTTDTEVILHLVARARRGRFIDKFIEALRQLEGSYSLAALTNKKLIGARDPLGIRPLVLGEFEGCPVITSETCALDIIVARYVRDVENGEVVVFSDEPVQSIKPFPPMPPRPCIFAYIYSPPPDSVLSGRRHHPTR